MHLQRFPAALLCGMQLLAAAQDGIRTYATVPAGLDPAQYGMAANGDLLVPNMRLAANGDVLWKRAFSAPGELIPGGFYSAVSHGSGLIALASVPVNFEYRTAVLELADDGAVISATRIVDPAADLTVAGVQDRIYSAPDGGYLVIKDNTYRFNADGTLRWARTYAGYERPLSVAWADDGGFYGVADGAGILRYAADGTPVRRMNTLGDTYDGTMSITVKNAPVLHNDLLYAGISTFYQDAGFFRINTGVMVLDTNGTILSTLMNQELLSPADDNALGAVVSLEVVGERLVVAMSQTSTTVGGRTYLLDCDLDLNDARWYVLPESEEYHVDAVFASPDGRALIAGVYGNDRMQMRFVPGTDLGSCFGVRGYSPAPFVPIALMNAPGASTELPITLEDLTVASTLETSPAQSLACTFTGLPERVEARWQLAPNPATDALIISTDAPRMDGVVQLLDAAGRVVLHARIAGPRTVLPVHQLPQGLYSVRLLDGAALQFLGKVSVAGEGR